MDFANIQAQLANLTSQLSQIADRTTMQSVPTFGVSYGHGYPTHQRPQFTANGDAWGYQGYDQPSNNMFSNTYNSDWRNYSNYMWGEPQQVQQDGYWQPYEEFYSRPAQPPQPHIQYAQPNSGSSIDYNQILDDLISSVQGSQNQDKEAHKEEYLPPSEEFYHWPYEPSQPPQQFAQFNSGTSLDNDTFNKLLTSLNQEVENRNKEFVEFMAQIQDKSEFSNANIVNSMEDFEITEAKTSKPSEEEDEQLLIEEGEEDTPTARVEQTLPQAPSASMLSNSGKVVPNPILSNPIPPNAPFPRRFLIPKEEESEKGIMEAFPKAQSDIPILGATNRIPEYVDFFEELCTPRRMIQEKEVAEKYEECIKEAIYETTKPKEVEFDDTGQVTTIVVNLATCKVPETFKDVVFVIEFLSNKASKPSSPISNSFSINMVLILMIQAPTLEFKPLPDHFKYHLPFKDQLQAVGSNGK